MACNQVTLIENGSTHAIPFYLNFATGTATNVVATFTVSAGLTLDSITAVDQTAMTVGSQTDTDEYTIASIPNTQTTTYTANVTVTDDTDVSALNVHFIVVSDETDANPVNNTITKNLCDLFNTMNPQWWYEKKYCLDDVSDLEDVFIDPKNPTEAEVLTWAQATLSSTELHNGALITLSEVYHARTSLYDFSIGVNTEGDNNYLGMIINGQTFMRDAPVELVTAGSINAGSFVTMEAHIDAALATFSFDSSASTTVNNTTTLDIAFNISTNATFDDIPVIYLLHDTLSYAINGGPTPTGLPRYYASGDCDLPEYIWVVGLDDSGSQTITRIQEPEYQQINFGSVNIESVNLSANSLKILPLNTNSFNVSNPAQAISSYTYGYPSNPTSIVNTDLITAMQGFVLDDNYNSIRVQGIMHLENGGEIDAAIGICKVGTDSFDFDDSLILGVTDFHYINVGNTGIVTEDATSGALYRPLDFIVYHPFREGDRIFAYINHTTGSPGGAVSMVVNLTGTKKI